MKNPFLLALLLALAVTNRPICAAENPAVWKPFEFMIGNWVGTGSEKSNQGSGEFSLNFDLGQKILVRKNRARLTTGAKQPATEHEDLMIIYPQPGNRFRADYYDNEGNVIHYGVSFGQNTAVFESDEPGTPTKFKLTYELKQDGTLKIDFAIAPPGKPFQTCLSGAAKRK
jgi:hypothetical protein